MLQDNFHLSIHNESIQNVHCSRFVSFFHLQFLQKWFFFLAKYGLGHPVDTIFFIKLSFPTSLCIIGRVAMSMTTLLTLSSMFNALTTITPPISYVTRLDIWMVCCICFVFLTLFEFTVVIFLKYYLRHLPTLKLDVFSSPPSGTRKKLPHLDIKSQVQAWVKVIFCWIRIFVPVRIFTWNQFLRISKFELWTM